MRMQNNGERRNSIRAAAGLRRRFARAIGAALTLCALICFCVPVSALAAEGRGTRLTGYAPLYLPSVVSITVQAAPATFGTVTGGRNGISPGENVTVTAQAGAGYYFTGWYEDNVLVSDAASYTFRADRDRHLIAGFSDNPEAASPNQGGNQDNNAGTDASGGNQDQNANTNASDNNQDQNANTNASGGNQDQNANTNASGGNQNQNANANASAGNQSATAGTSTAGGAAGSGTDSTTGTNSGAGNANSGSGAASTAGSSRIVPYVPANSNDMPTTGVGDMYRLPIVIVLLLFGLIAVLISIPSGRRRRR